MADTLVKDGSPFKDFALAARPYWKLSQMQGQDTCWPSYATNSSDKVVAPAELKAWPEAAGGTCPKTNTSFPTYWNAKQCSEDEIRVHYSLFFVKDGFKFLDSELFGHSYDWERIIVIYKRNTTNGDKNWHRDTALLSQHNGYGKYNWEDLKTSQEDDLDNLGSNNDHPTIYTAWAKHSMYPDAHTSAASIYDELTDLAYRDDHYKHFNTPDELIEVAQKTKIWDIMQNYKDWGHATSTPPSVYDSICSADSKK